MFSFKVNEHFGLNMTYHLKHFHVMFCMCDDKNNCRFEHRKNSIAIEGPTFIM
jgi:hypothetical protein